MDKERVARSIERFKRGASDRHTITEPSHWSREFKEHNLALDGTIDTDYWDQLLDNGAWWDKFGQRADLPWTDKDGVPLKP